MIRRVVIGEAEFRELVAGREVRLGASNGDQVDAIISDIGWVKMFRAVLDGIQPGRPPDPPQAREFLPLRRRR
jgi:hypothetical protein